MRERGRAPRASETITVISRYEPDMARQVKALLLVLGCTPKTTEGPGVWSPEPSHNNVTPQHTKGEIP